jgi:hypothetical protein
LVSVRSRCRSRRALGSDTFAPALSKNSNLFGLNVRISLNDFAILE